MKRKEERQQQLELIIQRSPELDGIQHRRGDTSQLALVYKEDNLINAPVDYSELEQKIIALVTAQIKERDSDLISVSFTVEDIAEAYSYKKDWLYGELIALSKSLTRPLTFPYIKDEELAFDVMPYFSRVNYESGIITFYFNQQLKPFLINVKKDVGKLIGGKKKKYTKYFENIFRVLKGKYTLRIYELLKRDSFKKAFTIELDELKKFLKLDENSSYNTFKDFQRRILKPALQEINEKSDLFWHYTPNKKGNKVFSLTIEVREKDDYKIVSETIKDLQYYGISEKSIRHIMQDLDVSLDDIQRNLEYVIERTKSGNIQNIASYLYKAIINNYAHKTPIEIEIEKEKENQLKLKQKNDEKIKQISSLKKEYDGLINDEIDKYLDKNPKISILQDIMKSSTNNFAKGYVAKALEGGSGAIEKFFNSADYLAFVRPFIIAFKIKIKFDFVEYLKGNNIKVTEQFLLNNNLI